ncbi:glycosyl hydrolase [Phytophthora cinnamomi]|uniref:glycosyl hydrolase n=1 Tax=Phytophthora cinnamomi TaxID=4785 RepID=UPI003559906E|nr:glycosyl hydrolase [Phytophthora cinnamomi]
MAQIAAYEIVNSTYQLDEDATRECTKLHVHPMIYGIDAVHGNSLLTTPCTSASKPTACPRSTRTWSTNKVSSLRVTPWRLGYLGSSAPSSTSRTTSGGCGRTRLSVKTRISPLRGMQSNNRTAACMKHWSAYSWNPTGHDMDEIVMADFDLLSTFVPSFKAAVDAGVLTGSAFAVIDGLLPCELGGQTTVEIVYGKVNPNGRLPIPYPKATDNVMIPYRHRVTTEFESGGYCEMRWDFGTRLRYTEFTQSNLTRSTANVASSSQSLDVSVTVANSGMEKRR